MSAEKPKQERYKIGFDEVISHAIENMLADGTHMPTFVIEGSKNVIVSRLQGLPETHGEKVELCRFLGQMTAKSGRIDQIQQVFMISEAWMVVASKEEPAKIKPSLGPNKKEVLLISGLQIKENRNQLKLFKILRDKDEQFTELEEFEPSGKRDESVENPLIEAFISGFQTGYQTKYN